MVAQCLSIRKNKQNKIHGHVHLLAGFTGARSHHTRVACTTFKGGQRTYHWRRQDGGTLGVGSLLFEHRPWSRPCRIAAKVPELSDIEQPGE